jgi:hypothetical protein
MALHTRRPGELRVPCAAVSPSSQRSCQVVSIEVGDDGSGFGPDFLLKPVGVRFFVNVTVIIFDFVLVMLSPYPNFRDKQFPNAVADAPHLVLATIPRVEVT